MSSELTDNIISALKEALPDAAAANLTPDTSFQDVPGFDSMASVSFQVELSKSLGEKAFEVSPIMEMTIAQYAELLT